MNIRTKILHSLVYWVSLSVMHAQGTFQFRNLHPEFGIDAPVFNAFGIPLSGSNYLAALYGGPTTDSLVPAISFGRTTFSTGPLAGYFDGGSVTVPNVVAGAPAWVQVRVWDSQVGGTYEEAVSRGIGGYGESSSLYLISGGAGGIPTDPTPLIGLQAFTLREIVPEPGAGVLLLIGMGLFASGRVYGRRHSK